MSHNNTHHSDHRSFTTIVSFTGCGNKKNAHRAATTHRLVVKPSQEDSGVPVCVRCHPVAVTPQQLWLVLVHDVIPLCEMRGRRTACTHQAWSSPPQTCWCRSDWPGPDHISMYNTAPTDIEEEWVKPLEPAVVKPHRNAGLTHGSRQLPDKVAVGSIHLSLSEWQAGPED